MNQIIKNILGWVAYFLIIFGFIYGIPRLMSYALNTPYPMAAITSGSMWPALKTGDIVFIRGIKDKSELAIGDIIVYRNPSSDSGQASGFTIHRVIKLNSDAAITRGDANNANDAPVPYGEIVGMAVSYNNKPVRIPMLGDINILLSKK